MKLEDEMTDTIAQIRKRNGTVVAFEAARIERAISKALAAAAPGREGSAIVLAGQVAEEVERSFVGRVPDPMSRTSRT